MKKLISFMLVGGMVGLYACGGASEAEKEQAQAEAETEVNDMLDDMDKSMAEEPTTSEEGTETEETHEHAEGEQH